MNLLNFFAFEFSDFKGIQYLDTEEFAGFGDLTIECFDLLGEGFLTLILLGG